MRAELDVCQGDASEPNPKERENSLLHASGLSTKGLRRHPSDQQAWCTAQWQRWPCARRSRPCRHFRLPRSVFLKHGNSDARRARRVRAKTRARKGRRIRRRPLGSVRQLRRALQHPGRIQRKGGPRALPSVPHSALRCQGGRILRRCNHWRRVHWSSDRA